MLPAGAHAPAFQLPDLGGTERTLAGIVANGPALLAFFKVSCPVCQYTFPFLERLHQGAVQIVGISQDKAGATEEFCREFGVTFTTLLDDPRNYAVSNAFAIANVPSLFLIEADGSVSESESGFSRRILETVGERAGVSVFLPGESVPASRPG
ncbi:MAG TPA: TlpA disulfide reductase family protein [Bryobacteraceae bacterium]|nr:TlpA disulfide reductase family protein [Bryobacteraceae bacterium]